MPADVLANRQQLAARAEQPGRVQAAGPVEHPLRLAKRVGQSGEHAGGHLDLVLGKPEPAGNAQFGDAGLTADAAGAAGQEVAPRPGRHTGPEGDVGDVAHRVAGLMVVFALAAVADHDGLDVGG